MKKNSKNFWFAVGVIALGLIVGAETLLAIRAWDNTMTDEQIISYLERWPDDKRLNQLADERNLKRN